MLDVPVARRLRPKQLFFGGMLNVAYKLVRNKAQGFKQVADVVIEVLILLFWLASVAVFIRISLIVISARIITLLRIVQVLVFHSKKGNVHSQRQKINADHFAKITPTFLA